MSTISTVGTEWYLSLYTVEHLREICRLSGIDTTRIGSESRAGWENHVISTLRSCYSSTNHHDTKKYEIGEHSPLWSKGTRNFWLVRYVWASMHITGLHRPNDLARVNGPIPDRTRSTSIYQCHTRWTPRPADFEEKVVKGIQHFQRDVSPLTSDNEKNLWS